MYTQVHVYVTRLDYIYKYIYMYMIAKGKSYRS